MRELLQQTMMARRTKMARHPIRVRNYPTQKYVFAARAVIIFSSSFIMVFLYLIADFMIDDTVDEVMQDGVQRIPNDHFLPDMADIMSWGQGGSGVIVDPVNLQDKEHRVDSENPNNQVFSSVPSSVKEEIQAGYKLYGLNEYVSNRISLRRSLPDMREAACRSPQRLGSNPRPLPDASVIIVFSKEPRSILLRTVFSILDRSPPELLKEILLVDHGSQTLALAYPQLENYLRAVSKKIKVVRSKVAMSYPEAVNRGAASATGTVAVFLNARCECTQSWLQPLLSWLVRSSFSIAVPLVDTIDGNTFRYRKTPMSEVTVGSFSWDMTITRRTIQEREEESSYSVPEPTPVIADGIFAVDRKLFQLFGGLTVTLTDRDLSHLEFSFKSWMCGRWIQLIPCSRIGLVSLPSAGSLAEEGESVAERAVVTHWWLGDFKPYAFERLEIPSETAREKLGLSDAVLDRLHRHPMRHLDCHEFRWFLERLEPAKLVAGRLVGTGRLQQQTGRLALTLDAAIRKRDLSKLHLKTILPAKVTRSDHGGLPEFWYMTDTGQLRTENNMCLYPEEEGALSVRDAAVVTRDNPGAEPRRNGPMTRAKESLMDLLVVHSDSLWHGPTTTGLGGPGRSGAGGGNDTRRVKKNDDILTVRCDFISSQARWMATKENWLLHIPSQKCIESQAPDNSTYTLRLATCAEGRPSQRWQFSHRQPVPQDQSVFDMLGL